MESRTQGSRPSPTTQKNSRSRTDLSRTEPLEAKVRNAGGQGPRHNAQVFYKKKKKKGPCAGNSQILRETLGKQKKCHDFNPFLTNLKLVLSSTEDRAFLRTCRLQGQELDLRSQGHKEFKMCPRESA